MHGRMGAVAAALALAAGSSEAREIYVSNEKGNSITIVDGDKLEAVATVPVGNRPRGIALSPDGKWLYICASDDDTVEIMAPILR
jgi:YVTN family beta-propeller protein